MLLANLLAVAPTEGFSADQLPRLDIGRSIFVVNFVDGQFGDTPPARVRIGDDIVFQEDISTGAEAKTVIEFRDGSTFEVGPDAVIRIDAFVFNPEESTSHKTLSISRGVFRYISGFVASDQGTNIEVPSGTIGIRGSVAAGIVDPEVPVFFHLAQGSATFTNDAGTSEVAAGQSIASPSRTTRPLRPEMMPPAVAAQALQAIERRLPPPAILRSRPAPGDEQLRREAAANLLPSAEQLKLQRAARVARPVLPPAPHPSVAGELGLLTEAQTHNLFDGAQPRRTPEQQAFLARAERMVPQAHALIHRSDAGAQSLHVVGTAFGTATVIRGVAKTAPSAEVLTRVATAAARANPAAAGIITQSSLDAYQGPDRARAADLIHRAVANPGRTRGSTAEAAAPRPRAKDRPAIGRAAGAPTAGARPRPAHPVEPIAAARPPVPHLAAGETKPKAEKPQQRQQAKDRRRPEDPQAPAR